MNYYEMLEVKVDASPDEIHKAYIHKAKMFHPDVNPDSQKLRQKMQDINEAYGVLRDEKRRKDYNEIIHISVNRTNKEGQRDQEESYSDSRQAQALWEEINKFYRESEAGRAGDVQNHKWHHYPLYLSLPFILLISILYQPYSLILAGIFLLARYMEFEMDHKVQKGLTDTLFMMLIVVGIVEFYLKKNYLYINTMWIKEIQQYISNIVLT